MLRTACQKTGIVEEGLEVGQVPAKDVGWSMPGQCRAAITKIATIGPAMKTRYQTRAGTREDRAACAERAAARRAAGGARLPGARASSSGRGSPRVEAVGWGFGQGVASGVAVCGLERGEDTARS